MNRTDRLLAIVLELQRKDNQRAEDLAAIFETSKRTIYRDIQALCESGVPVVSQPGLGYSLVKGYFLPPVSFSSDEATMLLLGNQFVADGLLVTMRVRVENELFQWLMGWGSHALVLEPESLGRRLAVEAKKLSKIIHCENNC
jgi:predicted DNA-binding transcriptional regulator YafY